MQSASYLSTQHMSSRCCGTCAGLRRAGQSERRQARKALVLLERSSLARPNHSRRRLGQVHSRKHSAGTSSGVRADLALPLLHSLTITGGTATQRQDVCVAVKTYVVWFKRTDATLVPSIHFRQWNRCFSAGSYITVVVVILVLCCYKMLQTLIPSYQTVY